MRAEAPLDRAETQPGPGAACLEYRIFLTEGGAAKVTAITGPTLNFDPSRGLRYGVSFDDEKPSVVELVPKGFKAQNGNASWEKSAGDNAHYGRSSHRVAGAGYHVLKIWAVDPGVVLQKVVIDLGGLKPSYLGPPESHRGPGNGP
jgi:hypothetical protein